MKSVTTRRFRSCFDALPVNIKKGARKAYALWKEDPSHPSLQFKSAVAQNSIYSVRVSLGYRAVGVKDGDTIIWFWIGSHAAYEELLKSLA